MKRAQGKLKGYKRGDEMPGGVVLHARMPSELYNRLSAVAHANGMTQSEFVRMLADQVTRWSESELARLLDQAEETARQLERARKMVGAQQDIREGLRALYVQRRAENSAQLVMNELEEQAKQN